MGIYYGINSNYASILFSSLNTSNTSNGIGGMTSLLQDYASIQNGSYGKLLEKYYALNDDSSDEGTSSVTDPILSTSKDSVKELKAMEDGAEGLKESADALIKSGTGSVFEKISKEDEQGNVIRGYDTDKIYTAVQEFVSDYNEVLEATEDANTSSIRLNRKSMMTVTQANESVLASLGISVATDGTLSVDEKKFKEADMSIAKSLFHGTGSYAYQISAKASMIDYYAQTEQSKSNTYTRTGNYSYNYSQGSLYDKFF